VPRTIRVLCVHGVGHQEQDTAWQQQWKRIIADGIGRWQADTRAECRFTNYDHLFDDAKLTAAIVAEAIFRLSASGIVHGIGDLFRRPRGIRGLSEQVRWTAGMVAQWAADEKLRSNACKAVKTDLDDFQPDVILAHSLGSLITYDLFARDQAAVSGRMLVTFGSQIGNPFVRSVFGGRIAPLSAARAWFHLYNKEDDVFAAPLRVTATNFEQVETFFDIEGMADHAAEEYLGHENTRKRVWRSLAIPQEPSRALTRTYEAFSKTRVKPRHRALLVGINDYPNPADRLEGCVNDVFEMSALLQELGLDPSDIRVVLNERATAAGVRDRLQWLLEGAAPGDTRVFFYSGHGAQIPGYSARDEVDDINECLVTYDFDWSLDRAIVDDWFLDFYSQLPYDTDFVSIFDCCHSGGMTRNGLPKARGLNPPDDIRHRTLRWVEKKEMWVPRTLRLSERKLLKTQRDKEDFLGTAGSTKRIGRAVSLWSDERQFEQTRKRYGHHGPYMPVLLQACQEHELSYEYRHGVTSYGAFTYCLTRIFRQMKRAKKPVTFDALIRNVSARLKELGYAQTPTLVGPAVKKTRKFPV
jgi:predicted alpha/beta hydrolase family esterase